MLLPPASEGWGKVMFSVCSHRGGGGQVQPGGGQVQLAGGGGGGCQVQLAGGGCQVQLAGGGVRSSWRGGVRSSCQGGVQVQLPGGGSGPAAGGGQVQLPGGGQSAGGGQHLAPSCGRYASCVHAGGLSCFKMVLMTNHVDEILDTTVGFLFAKI